jgi:hypothetical protein
VVHGAVPSGVMVCSQPFRGCELISGDLFAGQLQVFGGRFAIEGGHAFEPALLVFG